MYNFNVYNGVSDTAGKVVTLECLLGWIREGKGELDEKTKYANAISQTEPELYKKYKQAFPAVIFSATMSGKGRTAEHITAHTGLIVLDFDGVADIAGLMAELQRDPRVFMAFRSPSGMGVKVVLKVSATPTIDQHGLAYEQVCKVFDEDYNFDGLDVSGSDPNRLCFLSHDPQLIHRSDCTPIVVDYTSPEPKTEPEPKSYKGPITSLEMLACIPNNAPVTIQKDGEPKEVPAYDVWLQVGMALKNIGERVVVWDTWSEGADNYEPGLCEKKWESFKRIPDEVHNTTDAKTVGFSRLEAFAVAGGYKPPKQRKRRENPIPEMKDASQYFIHDDFNVMAMSEYIQGKFVIWAQDSGIYIYDADTGCYRPGELDIDLAVREELGELRKSLYVQETLKDLAVTCRRNVPDTSNLIGFQNGVLQLDLADGPIGHFSEHSPTNYLMRTFPVDFYENPEYTDGANDFGKWLEEVLDGDAGLVRVIFEVIGSIYHRASVDMQRGILMVGEGGTGKSMLLGQIQRMVGRDNICARAWGDYGYNDFAFGDLYEKSLALDSDIDVARPLSGAIKPAVTGNILTCNRKYQQPFDFNPHATWIGSINKFPRTRDKTWGFFRRWIAIPFNKTFKVNSKFEAEKRALWSEPETISRIVYDAIALYVIAYRNGSYTIPEAADELSREMYQAANSVISWLDTWTVKDPEATVSRSEAYQAYAEFCQQSNFDADNTRNFYATLRTQGYDVDSMGDLEGKRQRMIKGFYLK